MQTAVVFQSKKTTPSKMTLASGTNAGRLSPWVRDDFKGDAMKRREFLKNLGFLAVLSSGWGVEEFRTAVHLEAKSDTDARYFYLKQWLHHLRRGKLFPGRVLTARDIEGYPLG